MWQRLLKTLILGIYFRKSNFPNGNLTIACTDVSRLHPDVPAAGSYTAASKTGAWNVLSILSIYYWSHQQGPHLPLVYKQITTKRNITHPWFFLLSEMSSNALNFGLIQQPKTGSYTIKSSNILAKRTILCKKDLARKRRGNVEERIKSEEGNNFTFS